MLDPDTTALLVVTNIITATAVHRAMKGRDHTFRIASRTLSRLTPISSCDTRVTIVPDQPADA